MEGWEGGGAAGEATLAMTRRDVDAFVDKVEACAGQVQDLLEGRLSVEEFDKKEKRRELTKKAEKFSMEEKTRKKEEQIRMGTFGKGEKDNYQFFCRYCFTEYGEEAHITEPLSCRRCGKGLQTCEERREFLRRKVEDLKAEKLDRAKKRDLWKKWKKTHQMLRLSDTPTTSLSVPSPTGEEEEGESPATAPSAIESHSAPRPTPLSLARARLPTNYEMWNSWEPSSDEEEAKNNPVLPKHDPCFQAMEDDMKKRTHKRRERQKAADGCRRRGNNAAARGDYTKALEHYEEGLSYRKDDIDLYNNQAAVWLKLKNFERAIQCTESALDVYELVGGEDDAGYGGGEAEEAGEERKGGGDGVKKCLVNRSPLEVAPSRDAELTGDRLRLAKSLYRKAMGHKGLLQWKQAEENLTRAGQVCRWEDGEITRQLRIVRIAVKHMAEVQCTDEHTTTSRADNSAVTPIPPLPAVKSKSISVTSDDDGEGPPPPPPAQTESVDDIGSEGAMGVSRVIDEATVLGCETAVGEREKPHVVTGSGETGNGGEDQNHQDKDERSPPELIPATNIEDRTSTSGGDRKSVV